MTDPAVGPRRRVGSGEREVAPSLRPPATALSVSPGRGSVLSQRVLTAHHEAGHAVVGASLGLVVHHVALVDVTQTGRYGETALATPATSDTAPAYGAMWCAGHLAGVRWAAEHDVPLTDRSHGSESDHDGWQRTAGAHGVDLWSSVTTAARILTTCWPLVCTLASRLLAVDYLDGSEVHHLIDTAGHGCPVPSSVSIQAL